MLIIFIWLIHNIVMLRARVELLEQHNHWHRTNISVLNERTKDLKDTDGKQVPLRPEPIQRHMEY
jgi:hypothetical protein